MGGINRDDWKLLTEVRNVGSIYLTHLIRESNDDAAYKTLVKILNDGFLKASFSEKNGYPTVKGEMPVVCFQDSSFDVMHEIIEGEKWYGLSQIYREFGVQIDKWLLYEHGARPVIYDNCNDTSQENIFNLIDQRLWWRIVNLELSPMGYVDWTHEHEWRIPGDVRFSRYPIRIIVKTEEYKMRLMEEYIFKNPDGYKKENIIIFEEGRLTKE